MKKLFAAVLLSVTTLVLCAPPLLAGEINLFAAASLKEVLNELADSFAKTHPGVTFKKNYGASGALAKQIVNGAPADLFISANTEWMEFMATNKLIDEKSCATFAYNVLVFVGRPDSKVRSLHDLVKLERIAIGSPKSVPAGEYAVEALRKTGLYQTVETKLVMARDVRECLLYADRGEVDGAFVYKTDALQAARSVKVLFTVPQGYYPRVTYPVALTVEGARKADAVAFLALLKSEEALKSLKKHGFIVK